MTPTPHTADRDATIYCGDALEVLRELPAASVDCIATSPPFFGLRDYGVDGQIGLEATPELWAARLVEVFRECRRVLRDHGTLWVECGDSYAQGASGSRTWQGGQQGGETAWLMERPWKTTGPGLKPKDLIGQPFLLAFALRADGWYWRGCNIWAKPNAMPESAKDRCTVAHSYVMQFSKKARYFFDGDAIAEPASENTHARYAVARETPKGEAKTASGHGHDGWDSKTNGYMAEKHPRSVWTIPTVGYVGAHFATWAPKLAERIILAGCPEWVCSVCGRPRERIVESDLVPSARVPDKRAYPSPRFDPMDQGVSRSATHVAGLMRSNTTVGWSDCGHDAYQPGTILDPFLGSGTTALVARKHGRRCVGIELNEEYAQMAARRLSQLSLLAEATP